MKPKHIILCAVIFLATALAIMFSLALKKHNADVAKIQYIPDTTLTTYEGETFSLAEIKPEHKVSIMFFSTDCEFCRKEIEGIIALKDLFSDIEWVFVTISSIENLEPFLNEYPLHSIPGAKVCVEDFPELFISMNVTAPPALFIYDDLGNLEHYNYGAVSIKTILEWLK